MAKRITLLSLSLIKGGAENQLVKLALYLHKNNYQVKLIALLPQNDFQELLLENNIDYKLVPFKKGLGLINLVKTIKDNNTDVLVSFMFGANLISRFVKLFTKLKLITSVRVNVIDKKYYLLYKLTYKLDDISTFNSEVSLTNFTKKKLTARGNSFLINNAVKVSELEEKRGVNKVFTFVSIAHFRKQKDYKTLFESLKILKEQNCVFKLIVIGHLYNQSWPFDVVKKYGLTSEIEILGFQPNPSQFLKRSDALILSTHWEGTPNAVLEGMSNKLPIIASDVPGCRALLEKSKCGYLVKQKDPRDLASKMLVLMNMAETERIHLGNVGRKYIVDNYRESSIFKKWEELINS
ncbi:glycosyltransferase [Wenyingzhuangia sp. IMCC45533]